MKFFVLDQEVIKFECLLMDSTVMVVTVDVGEISASHGNIFMLFQNSVKVQNYEYTIRWCQCMEVSCLACRLLHRVIS